MDTKATFVGWDEFAQALGVTSTEIQGVFEKVAFAGAVGIREMAQAKVPKRSYVLMNSIIAEAIPGGAATSVMEIYGVYVEYGTGLYGPLHRKIVPKNAKVLAWKASTGQMIFARSTKGMKPQPFFNPAVDEGLAAMGEQLNVALDTMIAELATGK